MDEEVKALQQALGDLPERLADVLRTGGAEQADLDGPQRPGFPEGDEPEPRSGGMSASFDSDIANTFAATEDDTESPRSSPFATSASEADSSGLESKIDQMIQLLTTISERLAEQEGGVSSSSGGVSGGTVVEAPTTRQFSPIFNGQSYQEPETRVSVRTQRGE